MEDLLWPSWRPCSLANLSHILYPVYTTKRLETSFPVSEQNTHQRTECFGRNISLIRGHVSGKPGHHSRIYRIAVRVFVIYLLIYQFSIFQSSCWLNVCQRARKEPMENKAHGSKDEGQKSRSGVKTSGRGNPGAKL